jgi:hypothetical protein
MKQSYSEEANSGLPIQLFRKPKGQIPYSKSPCPVPDKFSPQATNGLFKINFNIILRTRLMFEMVFYLQDCTNIYPLIFFIPYLITSPERNT